MLEGMSHFVGLISPAGEILEVNRAALELMGLERHATMGKQLWDLPVWAPERQSQLQLDLAHVVAQKVALCYELEVLPSIQGPSFLDFCLHPHLDETGAVACIVVEGYDVTVRKQMETELRATQHWLQDAQAVAQIGSWELDVATKNVRWSPETFRLLGFPLSPQVPDYPTILDRHRPEDKARLVAAIDEASLHGTPYDLQVQVALPDGEVRWLNHLGRPIFDAQGTVVKLVGTSQNITRWKQLEQEQQRRERALTEVLDVMPHLALLVDPEGRVHYYNGHFYSFTGLPRQLSAEQIDWRLLISPESLPVLESMVAELARLREPVEFETRIIRHDGVPRWHLMRVVPIFSGGDEAERFVVTGTDISERRSQEEALHQTNTRLEVLATTDSLTGVHNRHALDVRLAREWGKSLQEGGALSVALLDVDHFKAYNDTYGHVCGDVVLKQLGVLLQSNARASDFVARYGGEEFMIVLPNTDSQAALRWAERMRSVIESRAWPQRAITVSVGIATRSRSQEFVGEPPLLESLIATADMALYRAKVKRNNVRVALYGEDSVTTEIDISGLSESATEQ